MLQIGEGRLTVDCTDKVILQDAGTPIGLIVAGGAGWSPPESWFPSYPSAKPYAAIVGEHNRLCVSVTNAGERQPASLVFRRSSDPLD